MTWRELDVSRLKDAATKLGIIFEPESSALQLAGLIEAKNLGIDPGAVFSEVPECFGFAWDPLASDVCAQCGASRECSRVFGVLLRQRQAAGGTPADWAEEFSVSQETIAMASSQPVVPVLMPTPAPMPVPPPVMQPPVAYAPPVVSAPVMAPVAAQPVLQIPVDPNAAPVKRGRGRPPKAAQPAVAAEAAPVKRGRGRPPKVQPAAEAAPVKRGRGRPPKAVQPAGAEAAPVKRGRGRPPKAAQPAAEAAPVKRGPGRPKKAPVTAAPEAAAAVAPWVNAANFPGVCGQCGGTGRNGAGICLVCGGTGRAPGAAAYATPANSANQGAMVGQNVASSVGQGAPQGAAYGGFAPTGYAVAAQLPGSNVPGNGAPQVLPPVSGQPGISDPAGGNGGDMRAAWAPQALPVVGGQIFPSAGAIPTGRVGQAQPGLNESLGGPYITTEQTNRVRALVAQGWDLAIALQRVGVVVAPS